MPGQRLPVGTYGLFEEKNRFGEMSKREGIIRRRTFEAANWDMTDEFGTHTMITRYKLRSIAEENEVVSERELDLVE